MTHVCRFCGFEATASNIQTHAKCIQVLVEHHDATVDSLEREVESKQFYGPYAQRRMPSKIGFRFAFPGPGMGAYDDITFTGVTIEEARTKSVDVTRMLLAAYRAGEADARDAIRRSLGITHGPWGFEFK